MEVDVIQRGIIGLKTFQMRIFFLYEISHDSERPNQLARWYIKIQAPSVEQTADQPIRLRHYYSIPACGQAFY